MPSTTSRCSTTLCSTTRDQRGLKWPSRSAYAEQISHAVRSSALLRCSGVLKALLAATPQGMVRYSDLNMCLKNVGMQLPGLQQGRWRTPSLDDWAGATAGRCMVLLAHLRRRHHSSARLAQCSSKLSEPGQDELADLVSRLGPDRSPFNKGTSMTSMAEPVVSDGLRMNLKSGPPRDTNLMTQTPQVFFTQGPHLRSKVVSSMLMKQIKILMFDAGLRTLITGLSVLT